MDGISSMSCSQDLKASVVVMDQDTAMDSRCCAILLPTVPTTPLLSPSLSPMYALSLRDIR